jgi:single-stranded-DNA-specific exonuclease
MRLAARMQKKVWNITPPDPSAQELADQLKVSPVLAQVLINRDINTPSLAQQFLNPKLTDLIEPEQMPGAVKAAKHIVDAINQKKRIVIYGDYDVDGITSTSILWHLLELLGATAEYYIPHRIDEGYGLNAEAIKRLAENDAQLIITVDCGITAVEEIKLANSLGMEVIITDHHLPSGSTPDAIAIVHPGLDGYANPDSAGAMVALKLAWAIVNITKTTGKTDPHLREFLLNATTLAAMGTIADVVDLRGENRILASFGLKSLVTSKLTGIKSLIETAELGGKDIDSYHIAFKLAPLLNAAGRMGHARLAVELMTSDNQVSCHRTAEYLKQQNSKRQQLQRKIFKQAKEMITTAGLNHPERRSIVLASDEWHTGVIGIVASRVIDEYFKPTIMINTSNGLGQGSGRSIDGFDLYAGLCACSQHLKSFGGHKMAAGLKIEKDNIPAFADAFEEHAAEHISDEQIVSHIDIDGECRISDLDESTVRQLNLLEPFGQGNPKPVFATNGVHRISPPRRVGIKGDHLQIAISDNTASVRCIGFNMGKLEKKLLEADQFSVVYEPDLNTYNGRTSVQFVLTDIRFD